MKSIYIIILFCSVLLTSCGDILDSDGNIRKEPVGGDLPGVDYFPNKVGNYWMYSVINKSGKIIDTLVVTVGNNTDSRTQSDSKLWTYRFIKQRGRSTVKYVKVEGNLVYEYNDPDERDGVVMYDLPIEVGKSWYIGRPWDRDYSDSATVVSQEQIRINEFDFENAYQIILIYNDDRGPKTRELRYFVPYVGIVFSHYARFSEGEQKIVLFDYDLQ